VSVHLAAERRDVVPPHGPEWYPWSFRTPPALFFLAFLPQFVDADGAGVWSQALVLGFVFVGLGLVTDSLYALAAGTVGGLLRRRPRTLRYGSGVVFIGLGATAALAKRA